MNDKPGWSWLKTHPEHPRYREVVDASVERFRRPSRKIVEATNVAREVKRSLKRAAKGE